MEEKQTTIHTLFAELEQKGFLGEAKNNTISFIKLMSYYKCAIMEVETKFNVLNESFSIRHDRNPISSVKTRLKTPQSIIEKIERRNLPLSIETIENNLNDIAGVRVCCSFIEDVYMLADALLSQDDVTLIKKKDYIEKPKANGYRSLHLIISVPIYLASEKREMKVEIQLRTIAMDFWASLEHQMRYKKDRDFTEEMAKELLVCADTSADLDRRMSKLRKLIQDEN